MRRALLTLAAVLAVVSSDLVTPAMALAQKVVSSTPGKGGSPHETVEYKVGDATVTITYGRPYLKGRTVETLAPAGKVWRTGADEATTLKTDKALQIGWQLIVNKLTGQWGTVYQQSDDLGRVPMTAGKLAAPAEQLVVAIVGSNLEVHLGSMKQSVAISAK